MSKFFAVPSLLVCLLLVYYYSYNFHEVIYHSVYRSRQLPDAELKYVIHRYKIKSVINLRGENNGKQWYDREINLTRTAGIKHYDVRLSSMHLPDKNTLEQLIYYLDTAPRPLLFHCAEGVDRTSFAALISLLLHNENSLTKLHKQISLSYFVFSPHSIGNQLFEGYIKWLRDHNLKISRQTFLLWVDKDYSRYHLKRVGKN